MQTAGESLILRFLFSFCFLLYFKPVQARATGGEERGEEVWLAGVWPGVFPPPRPLCDPGWAVSVRAPVGGGRISVNGGDRARPPSGSGIRPVLWAQFPA